ncbi:cardiolipin synthase [Devosia subaequoris]|uniref:Phospholipase D n=1 Tax=Devosia subaequoris TaxID=395930 RepID=A0A7W6NAW6_9HYPH|nr:cardiolipin synthase [Devosia subaequoris]MCP1208912.1 phospholipase D-like domain-containing protein [Devosia subaequoris]
MTLFSKRTFAITLAAVIGAIGTLLVVILTPEPHELTGPVPATLSTTSNADFVRSMLGIHSGQYSAGNEVLTLQNGAEIFPAMLDAIANAEASINLETYVYWSGAIGARFAEALAERAAAGVEVNVLLDWQGSVPMRPELIELMTAAGVVVERFRPVHWYTIDRLNSRTHRKLLVVDGRIGFIGGVGIADKWLGDARNPDEFRELHYRVEGPIVAAMQGAFVFNWVEASGHTLQGPAYFPELDTSDDGQLAQLVYSTTGARNVMHLMLMTAISAAQNNIRIGTAYFVPDEIALRQLLAARERGVRVDIMVPGKHTNKDVVRSASRHFWGDLLRAGVNIYEFDPTMYHAKMMIVDDRWTTVGSANFDERSFRLNDEANLNLFGADFAREQIQIFEQDLAKSTPVSLEQWEDRPISEKALDWLASVLRVQL